MELFKTISLSLLLCLLSLATAHAVEQKDFRLVNQVVEAFKGPLIKSHRILEAYPVGA
jgi:hypothetical protein